MRRHQSVLDRCLFAGIPLAPLLARSAALVVAGGGIPELVEGALVAWRRAGLPASAGSPAGRTPFRLFLPWARPRVAEVA